jgi:hypothetical protein
MQLATNEDSLSEIRITPLRSYRVLLAYCGDFAEMFGRQGLVHSSVQRRPLVRWGPTAMSSRHKRTCLPFTALLRSARLVRSLEAGQPFVSFGGATRRGAVGCIFKR